MKQNFLSELFLYRYRYIIGYLLLALLTVTLLFMRLDTVPPGYSGPEQASAIASFHLTFSSDISMVDLPYHLLQKATIRIFGMSELGLRLPSILVGFATALGFFYLLSRWFAKNIAIIVSILAVTSSYFLMVGRTGTSAIMLSFWAVMILLFATRLAQDAKWPALSKLALIVSVGLSLYTPHMIYLLAAMVLSTLVHPHLRYTLRSADKAGLVIAVFLGALFAAPLGYYVYLHHGVWHDLLGVPIDLPSPRLYAHQLVDIFSKVGNPFNATIGTTITPMLSIPAVALGLIGLAYTLKDYHSSRSHVLLLWGVLLLPVLALEPNPIPALYVPLMLLVAIGLNEFIRKWYRFFPRNPYARFVGLLPIGALLFVIVQFNYQRYFTGLAYSPVAASSFTSDPQLLQQTIRTYQLQNDPLTVIAPTNDNNFYQIATKKMPTLQLMTLPQLSTMPAGPVIVAESTYQQMSSGTQAAFGIATHFVVNDHQNNALRFRVFIKK